MGTAIKCVLMLGVLGLAMPGLVSGQAKARKAWGVYKVMPVSWDEGKLVAEADTAEEAQRIEKQFQDREYRTGRFPYYVFVARKREAGASSGKVGDVMDQTVTRIQEARKARAILNRIIEAKKAVDRAKKVAKGDEPLLKASERKFGDAIKEYKDLVVGAFQRATELKKTLTEGVGGMTEARFKQATEAVQRYNRLVENYQSATGRDGRLGYTTMTPPRRQPPRLILAGPGGKTLAVPLSTVDPKGTAGSARPSTDLVGRVAEGRTGGDKGTFRFNGRNKVAIAGALAVTLGDEGEWALSGDRLVITTRRAVVLGTLEGDKLVGKQVQRAGTGLKEWTATLARPGTKTEDALVGTTWEVRGSHRRVGNGFLGTYTFLAEGKCVWKEGRSAPSTMTWTREGNRITVRQDHHAGGPFTFDFAPGTMKGGNGEWRVTLTKQ